MVAVMRTTRRPIGAARVKLTILCRQKVTTTSGGETSTTYTDLYKKELDVDASSMVAEGEGTLVPVVAVIPAAVPATGVNDAPEITWRPEVSARTLPVALKSSFDLPVFKADESEIKRR
jgi:hypothetical protein